MATITILRPSATSSSVGWSGQPSGTPDEVTSDDSDLTWAEWSGSGSALVLATPLDSPPVGERRHLVRIRARGEDGDSWWAVRLASGVLVAGASASFPSSPSTVVGSWGPGAPADGPTILSAYVTGQSADVKVTEIFLDVDSRQAPTFTPQILDGSGAVTTTVSDTVAPTLRANALDLDGLVARQYRYWVTLGGDIVWDTGVISGPPLNQSTTPLDNGSYVAHYQVWSTLGANTEYPSAEETLSFTLAVGQIPAPIPPTVIPDSPLYDVQVCAPNVGAFDGSVGYLEIQRVDCPSGGDLSSQSVAVTIAILGPLATDECASWTDYTMPRGGQGRTCDYDPEPCCSYYRVRTVGRIDGLLLVSEWSDADNPGVAPGLIVAWPDTDASIPSGWNRVTELDARHPKGVPDGTTQPGATGGATSHTHVVPDHSHDITHGHTTPTPTAAATGTVSSADGAAGTLAVSGTHTHTRPTVNSATTPSGSETPVIGPVDNDPDHAPVIWIGSDGSSFGVPPGAVALMGDIAPAGWDTYASATDRFLKGAAGGADGGGTVAGTLAAHSHSIAAHTHAGTNHFHTSPNAGSVSSTLSLFSGPNSVIWQTSHSHAITIANAVSGSLTSASGGSSSNNTPGDPTHRKLRVRQNISLAYDLPVGLIALWRGSLGSMPASWQLCDGTNGTPDMFGRYARGATSAIGDPGGGLNLHSHTSPTHTHTTSGHAHTSTTAPVGSGADVSATATVSVATAAHTHTLSNTNSTTPTPGNSDSGLLVETDTEPLYEEVAFVQLMETPVPPGDPETYCLDWSEDEHLIRTTGPDGPMWVPVIGRFEWDVDRPFTSTTGVNGGRFVTSAPPGERNLRMTTAVESETDLAALHAILARPLVLISPSDSSEVWAAPVTESVRVVKVGRIRQVSADFIGTGPEPPPQLADVGG